MNLGSSTTRHHEILVNLNNILRDQEDLESTGKKARTVRWMEGQATGNAANAATVKKLNFTQASVFLSLNAAY